MWAAPNQPPITTVMRDRDLKLGIEGTIEDLFKTPPGPSAIERPIEDEVFDAVFFVYEVFDMQNADMPAATIEAKRRLDKRALEEQNMAVLYYYNAQALVPVNDDGHLINPRPAPLRADDIDMTLKQLAKHPNYKPGQTIHCTSHDGIDVTMKAGEVSRKRANVRRS